MHEHPVTITEAITKCQSNGETISIDIGSPCPTLKQLKTSFKKLKSKCIFRSSKDYWESDSSWLGDIEETGWLSHVSSCLELVRDITKKIHEKQTSVIVCDPDGRHFAILITSLVQILLDPYYRSLMGLQALIQKDWVMKGFPFCQRLHHIQEGTKSRIGSQIRTASFKGKDERRDKDLTYGGESPVFVLFLECLHQLIRQHPLEFEYTEQFLILLYDASYSCLFGTFLFNSSYELDESQNQSNLMTVWDFIATNIPQSKYISVFTNASYKLDLEQDEDLTDGGLTSNMQRKMSLHLEHRNSVITDVVSAIPRLLLWDALFFRWLPCTDFHKGCSREVVLQLQQIQYMDEIYYLKDRLNQLRQQLKPRDLLSPEPDSNRTKKRHKRNASRFSNNEEVRDDFLIIMTGFHFLKML